MIRKVYSMKNLDCANCAAKIEQKFNAHKDVQEAVITFSTRQLRLTAEDPDALIPELTRIARTVEGEVEIHHREEKKQEHSAAAGMRMRKRSTNAVVVTIMKKDIPATVDITMRKTRNAAAAMSILKRKKAKRKKLPYCWVRRCCWWVCGIMIPVQACSVCWLAWWAM